LKVFTHTYLDWDGGLATGLLKLFGEQRIPGTGSAEISYWRGELESVPQQEVVFVDICPAGVTTDPEKKIFDFSHHPHKSHPWKTESKNRWEQWHTATSKVVEFLGLDLNDQKIADLVRQAYRADFNSGGDPMNIANVVKEMHLLFEDKEIQEIFLMMLRAHFKVKEIDFQKGIEFFKNTLEKFFLKNKDSPAEKRLQGWLQRSEKAATEDKMNIVYWGAIVLTAFGSQKTENWLTKILKGVEQGQRIFQGAKKDFELSEKILLGRRVVVIRITNNPRFNRYCRSSIAKQLMPRPLNAREDPIVVQFQPGNKGFQIFTNRSGFKLSDIVAALRVEILRIRKKKVPPNWMVLKQEGRLEGTEPLYYQAGRYQVVMWGSLTTPATRPMDIPREIVRRIVTISVDYQYFPDECKKTKECSRQECLLYPWHMQRCYKKRCSNRKSLKI